MPQPVRPFLGESAASRVNNRRRQFIDKAFELMVQNTWRECSIAQLCRDVGLNKRYFYESFESLGMLEDAVVEDLTAALLQIGFSAAHDALQNKLSTEALARDVLGKCIAWLVSEPGRARVLFSQANDNPRAKAHRDAVIGQLAQALSTFGVAYHHPSRPQVEVTAKHHALAKLSAALLIGGTIESILNWTEGGIDLSLEEFTASVASFWVALGNSAVNMATEEAFTGTPLPP